MTEAASLAALLRAIVAIPDRAPGTLRAGATGWESAGRSGRPPFSRFVPWLLPRQLWGRLPLPTQPPDRPGFKCYADTPTAVSALSLAAVAYGRAEAKLPEWSPNPNFG